MLLLSPYDLFQDVDSDLEISVSNFKALILALLRDPAEKAYFFQVNEVRCIFHLHFIVMPTLSILNTN